MKYLLVFFLISLSFLGLSQVEITTKSLNKFEGNIKQMRTTYLIFEPTKFETKLDSIKNDDISSIQKKTIMQDSILIDDVLEIKKVTGDFEYNSGVYKVDAHFDELLFFCQLLGTSNEKIYYLTKESHHVKNKLTSEFSYIYNKEKEKEIQELNDFGHIKKAGTQLKYVAYCQIAILIIGIIPRVIKVNDKTIQSLSDISFIMQIYAIYYLIKAGIDLQQSEIEHKKSGNKL